MKQLPAIKVSILLSIGITFSFWLHPSFLPILLSTIAAGVLSLIFRHGSIGQLPLVISIICSGALLYTSAPPPECPRTENITVTGRITEPPVIRENFMYYPLEFNKIGISDSESSNAGGKLWVSMTGINKAIKCGSFLTIKGTLTPTKPPRNPGDFDLHSWRKRNGYFGEFHCEVSHAQLHSDDDFPVKHRVRNYISGVADTYGGENAPLLKALLVGFRRELDPEFREILKITGLSHLIALSGLHIGFFAGIMIALGAIFRLKPSWRATLAIIAVILLMTILPPRGSTLRAAVMVSVLLSGRIFRQWSHSLNALGVAAMMILIIRPGDLFDVGFQLSFAAVGGIIVFSRDIQEISFKIRKRPGKWSRLADKYAIRPLLISLSASVLIWPLTSHYFGLISLGTPLFNLVAIPVLSLIYAGSWLLVAASLVWSGAAYMVADALVGLIFALKWTTGIFAEVAPVWETTFVPVTVLLLLSLLTWSALRNALPLRRIVVFTVSVATILILNNLSPKPSQFQAWFLDVGIGDAAIWRFPDGRVAVIDGGPAFRRNNRSAISRVLHYFGYRKVDLMVMSHPEADHISGLIDVVKLFPVGCAVSPPTESSTLTYRTLDSISTAKSVIWHKLSSGDKIRGLPVGYNLEVLGPPAGAAEWTPNNASLVILLSVQCGEKDTIRLLTTGDIERLGETALIGSHDLRAELLKIPHHGSKTSTTPEFLAHVNPEIALISNSHSYSGHNKVSSGTVVDRLKSRGVEIHHTGMEGAVLFEVVETDTGGYWKTIDWRNPVFPRWFLGIR